MSTGGKSHAEVFNDIYRNNVWRGGSGTGSTLESARPYMVFLRNFLTANRIKSVVDLGCGDWQFAQHFDWTGVDYTGVDVSSVVLEHTRQFARPGIRFVEADARNGELPAADLLIAKDVLQHWCNGDVLHFLPVLQRFRFALVTNGFPPWLKTRVNAEIAPGDVRPVDLSAAPFGISGAYVFWYQADEPKYVFLWQNPGNVSA